MGNQDDHEEFEISNIDTSALTPEQLKAQMEEAGFVDPSKLAEAVEEDHNKKINATAEALGAHLQPKLSDIGAREVSVIPANKENEAARVKITDVGGASYFLDIRLDANGNLLPLVIPPALNPVAGYLEKVFEQMKTYGRLAPHSIEEAGR